MLGGDANVRIAYVHAMMFGMRHRNEEGDNP